MDARTIIDALPAAVCTTNADGQITYYNEAAAETWGARPKLGQARFCGSRKLFRVDGSPLPHDESPLAVALRERRALDASEMIAERPDGTRAFLLCYPRPQFAPDGTLTGAVNLMIDVTTHMNTEPVQQRLAAIVESSGDAIIAKDLSGIITDWNQGAERLFGYSAEEAIGQPIMILVPDDRQAEEAAILARLRQGDRIEHFETVRRRRDGELIDISLSVSPVRNALGVVVGASKIARDITERRRAAERQELLLGEMNHRVKNLLVLAGGVVGLSARTASTVEDLANDARERLSALARAHELTLPRNPSMHFEGEASTSLHVLIRTIISPFDDRAAAGGTRVTVRGADVRIPAGGPLTSFALLLHEFATNAAKYGALSSATGLVDILCVEDGERFVLRWEESGGPAVGGSGDEGFGSLLAQATVRGQLGGEIAREWRPEGLRITLSVARDALAAP